MTLAEQIAKLDAWFDSIRSDDGYGGPVVHWWQNSLHYTGAGLDWRYEGIVHAYLNLYSKTRSQQWLEKAQRAANDLVRGQQDGGNYRFSAFEQNPHAAGTPHEAAADIALLAVAKALRAVSLDASIYIDTARKNIEQYYIQYLWNDKEHYFQDNPSGTNIVPNKAATLVEALLLLAEVTGDDRFIYQYAKPTLAAIVAHQVTDNPATDGAIYQLSRNGHFQPWFFPYYAARCVPALVQGYQLLHDEQLLKAAKQAMNFVHRHQYGDGSYAQIIYGPNKINRYPQWIAGNGDILRAFRLLEPYDYVTDLTLPEQWLFNHQHEHGPFHTAFGFNSQIHQRVPQQGKLPDLRDILPVAGWTDKAFLYLTDRFDGNDPIPAIDTAHQTITVESQLRGRRVVYVENSDSVVISFRDKPIYHWIKGENWADIRSRQLIWK